MDQAPFSDDLWQLILILLVVVIYTASWWRILAKADENGWQAIFPRWRLSAIISLTGKPEKWEGYLWIPLYNLYIIYQLDLALAKSFGKSERFGQGLFFLPFIFAPILGFGSAEYLGPEGKEGLENLIDEIGRDENGLSRNK